MADIHSRLRPSVLKKINYIINKIIINIPAHWDLHSIYIQNSPSWIRDITGLEGIVSPLWNRCCLSHNLQTGSIPWYRNLPIFKLNQDNTYALMFESRPTPSLDDSKLRFSYQREITICQTLRKAFSCGKTLQTDHFKYVLFLG